jgi:excisionase family DNA binding protein
MTTDPIQPVLIRINQAATMIGQNRRTIYSLIAADRLKAVKSGRSTLIFLDSVRQYIASLPPARIRLDARAKRHLEAAVAA